MWKKGAPILFSKEQRQVRPFGLLESFFGIYFRALLLLLPRLGKDTESSNLVGF